MSRAEPKPPPLQRSPGGKTLPSCKGHLTFAHPMRPHRGHLAARQSNESLLLERCMEYPQALTHQLAQH